MFLLVLAAALTVSLPCPPLGGDDFVTEAVVMLIDRQEAYVPDPPVGRLDDDELGKWQAGESARLAKLRSATKANAGSEWPYEGVYRIGPDGRIPPGYRVGGTSIVSLALIQAPGYAQDEPRREAVDRATRFVLTMLAEDPQLSAGPKDRYDVRGWGHTYALTFFLRALDLDVFTGEELESEMRAAIPDLISRIAACEEDGGGWNYASGRISPFMTGSTLLALYHAAASDFEVDAALVTRALDALQKSRADNVAFAYSGNARGKVAMPGSAARSSIAELALHLAGRSELEDLATAVDGFFTGYDDLLKRKSQQGTHEGAYNIAPYYFFFGHTYVAQAIESLPESQRPALRAKLHTLIASTRDEDASWNDRIFPRTASYSTAMVVLALVAADQPTPPGWPR